MLKHREAKEVSAEQALALAHSEYNRRLTMLENTRRQLEETLKTAGKSDLDVFEVMHLSFYRTSLSQKINSREQEVAEARRRLDFKRSEAVQARQDRQIIEKIKDKDLTDYKREVEVREQKESDELALYAHLRRIRQARSGVVFK